MNFYKNKFLVLLILLIGLFAILSLVKGPPKNGSPEALMIQKNEDVQARISTIRERFKNATITVPNTENFIQLKNGKKDIIPKDSSKSITTVGFANPLQTKFLEGKVGVREPRLDAIVPTYLRTDDNDAWYVYLLEDGGGQSIVSKSYAFLGNRISIEDVSVIDLKNPKDKEEYVVRVQYYIQKKTDPINAIPSVPKEVAITVENGRFNPDKSVQFDGFTK